MCVVECGSGRYEEKKGAFVFGYGRKETQSTRTSRENYK